MFTVINHTHNTSSHGHRSVAVAVGAEFHVPNFGHMAVWPTCFNSPTFPAIRTIVRCCSVVITPRNGRVTLFATERLCRNITCKFKKSLKFHAVFICVNRAVTRFRKLWYKKVNVPHLFLSDFEIHSIAHRMAGNAWCRAVQVSIRRNWHASHPKPKLISQMWRTLLAHTTSWLLCRISISCVCRVCVCVVEHTMTTQQRAQGARPSWNNNDRKRKRRIPIGPKTSQFSKRDLSCQVLLAKQFRVNQQQQH